MIANVSFREIVILSSDVFVKRFLAFTTFSNFYFLNALISHSHAHHKPFLSGGTAIQVFKFLIKLLSFVLPYRVV